MERNEVEAFVKRLIYTIWECQELSKLDHFYSTDVVGYYNQDKVDFLGLKKKVEVFHQHMKNLKIEILHLVIEKERYALHANQKFTTQEGKQITIPSMLFAHLKEGKICKYWLKTKMPLNFE